MRVKEFVKRITAKIADVINGCPNCEKEREEFWKTFESGKPFTDIQRSSISGSRNQNILRFFEPGSPAHQFKWHADETDRNVTVISEAGDWKFQFDNELPFDLTLGKSFKIPKGKIHRLIKTSDTVLALSIDVIR